MRCYFVPLSRGSFILSRPPPVNLIPLPFPSTPSRRPHPTLSRQRPLYATHTVQRIAFETPGQTGIRGGTDSKALQAFRIGEARRRDRGCQVCIILNAALSLTKNNMSCRPTGWDGESGAADSGGHITVHFCSSSREHVVTHHVYRTDGAYPRAT
jgi:hypothetical protein